ncbi:hypothetical protein RIF29_00880 [Crotalaria pallida]|uniref:Uncharacterized protein n=1 Tax=Crotalaria pallida TaxID=3830 RepID=A0AAN9P7T7_CROPI
MRPPSPIPNHDCHPKVTQICFVGVKPRLSAFLDSQAKITLEKLVFHQYRYIFLVAIRQRSRSCKVLMIYHRRYEHKIKQVFKLYKSKGCLYIVTHAVLQVIFCVFQTMMLIMLSGGLLIGRTLAVFITMTLTTSVAAKQGPIPMAGHQICMKIWLSISLLTDALALAGQALLASNYSEGNYEQARVDGVVIYRVLQIGLGAGITLSVILFFGFGAFSSLFSTDSEVPSVAQSDAFPVCAFSV